MKLSITDAAKAAGVSRSTLSRDVSKGKVSVTKDGKGRPHVELVELERVYGNVNMDATSESVSVTHHDTTYIDALLQSKESEIALLKQQLDAVTQRLDVSESERRRAAEQVTALLTDQRARGDAEADIEKMKTELETERRRGFWSRLWRR